MGVGVYAGVAVGMLVVVGAGGAAVAAAAAEEEEEGEEEEGVEEGARTRWTVDSSSME